MVKALAVFEPVGAESGCIWVQHGAMLNAKAVHFPLRKDLTLRLYLDGNEVSVDLSQFEVLNARVDFEPLIRELQKKVCKLQWPQGLLNFKGQDEYLLALVEALNWLSLPRRP